MCLIVLAWQVHPRWPLLLVAHRDEFRDRPSAPLAWWTDPPILAGRDLRAGGGWLGVARNGRFAALTNVRQAPAVPATRSRGIWVPRALAGSEAELARQLDADAANTGAFNLLHGDRFRLSAFHSPDGGLAHVVSPGVHALSNARLDTPWPKVRESRARLRHAMASGSADALDEALLWSVTAHADIAPDATLPHTGIGPDWERRLAPPLILGPVYGTVSRTLLALGADGAVRIVEQQLDADGRITGEARDQFNAADAVSV